MVEAAGQLTAPLGNLGLVFDVSCAGVAAGCLVVVGDEDGASTRHGESRGLGDMVRRDLARVDKGVRNFGH